MAGKKKEVGGDEGGRDELLVVVGARIKELRNRSGITQRQFAEAAGLTQAYIYLLEAGGQNITLTVLARVAAALGVSVVDLLEGSEGVTRSIDQSLVRLANAFQKMVHTLEERGARDAELLNEIKDLSIAHQALSEVLLGAAPVSRQPNKK